MTVVDDIRATVDAALTADRTRLVNGGREVYARWGDLIERYRGAVPASLVAVRIWHETRGNPRATSREDERGLLQLYPWARSKYDVAGDGYDPATNVWAGMRIWNKWALDLHERYPSLPGVGPDWWGLSNLNMSIGIGATRRLVAEAAGGYSHVLAYVRNAVGFAQLPGGYWGSQSHRLVAKRVAATSVWLSAAAEIAPVVSTGHGRLVPRDGDVELGPGAAAIIALLLSIGGLL